jgi:hypothetical protein
MQKARILKIRSVQNQSDKIVISSKLDQYRKVPESSVAALFDASTLAFLKD